MSEEVPKNTKPLFAFLNVGLDFFKKIFLDCEGTENRLK